MRARYIASSRGENALEVFSDDRPKMRIFGEEVPIPFDIPLRIEQLAGRLPIASQPGDTAADLIMRARAAADAAQEAVEVRTHDRAFLGTSQNVGLSDVRVEFCSQIGRAHV